MMDSRRKATTEEKRQRFAMTLLFSAVCFCIQLVTVVLAGIILWFLVRVGIIAQEETLTPTRIILFMAIFSLIIGSATAFLAAKFPLKPINRIISRMNRLASGDFSTRLEYGKPISDHPAFRAMSDSFNKMAAELQNTEMLRSDFINNFSHEFKTPIVSIAGFAKLLRRGNLTEEQREEYLTIIEEESMRLSYMATNVLNMTKVENQTILTDVKEYNLSEQIRACLLLLEPKWSKKNLDLNVEFGEYPICANEELLKQVWINLIDNAVKFTPNGGTVDIRMTEAKENLYITIANTGSEIPPEKLGKIWGKFYQADESHSSEGNGIGLAIVKKVTELHGGEVTVKSGNGMTSFTVLLPTVN